MKTTELTPPPKTFMTNSWDLVKPSLELVKKHVEQVIYLFLLPSLTYGLGSLLLGGDAKIEHLDNLTGRQELGVIILLIGFIWSLLNLAPSVYFRVRVGKGKSPSIGECYRKGLPYFWRLWAVDILVGLVVIIGLVLLIVPGIIFLRRYYLAPYYLIDKKLGIIESMKRSSHDSKPVSGYIWGVIGVQVVFSLIGSGLSLLPALGIVLSALVGYVCLFVPVLRYKEVLAATPKKD
jgi:hypothetical protein